MARKRTTKNTAPKEDKGFNAGAFYNALTHVVEARKVPWIKVSRETGVTTSTLSRMAVGRRPDAASLAVLSAWAGLNPAHFVRTPQEGTLGSPGLLRSISDVLRADPSLQSQAARELAAIIRLAYEVFTKKRDDRSVLFNHMSETVSCSRKKLKIAREGVLKEANFSHWANTSLWTVDQAAFLLLGYEPIAECEIPLDNLPNEYSVLRRLLLKNAGVNLRLFDDDPRSGPRFRSRDVIEWAQSRSLLVPEKLKGRIS